MTIVHMENSTFDAAREHFLFHRVTHTMLAWKFGYNGVASDQECSPTAANSRSIDAVFICQTEVRWPVAGFTTTQMVNGLAGSKIGRELGVSTDCEANMVGP